jgi:hypothetical protein
MSSWLCSNLKLLPYQAQLAHYVLERVAAGDASMGQGRDVDKLKETLACFLTKAEALRAQEGEGAGLGAAGEADRALAEAAPFVGALGLFLLSRQEWEARAKPLLIKAMACLAGIRKVRSKVLPASTSTALA